MRQFLSIIAISVVAACTVANVPSLTSAVDGENFSAEIDEKGSAEKEYISTVGDFVARLKPYDGWRAQSAGRETSSSGNDQAVSFTGYLPFPNPHSSPSPFVVVGDTSDLVVRISGIEVVEDCFFEFRGVEKEIYRFWLSGPIGEAKWCTMSVEANAATIGSVKMPVSSLVAGGK